MQGRRAAAALVVAVSVLVHAVPLLARQGATVVQAAGPQYEASKRERLFLGDNYRDLWTTPVRAPVLDLGSFAGGLEPFRRGGSAQSLTLHMRDASGRRWVFRSIDKFPERTLSHYLRGTPAGSVIQDQVSALHPGGAFMLPPLLRAAGILHVEPQLYVMPDDSRLGEYRETFAGVLGAIELRPDEGPDDSPGFAGSRAIKGSEEFLDDLEDDPANRLDEREFLRARLIDFLVGDPDRGLDQWRWARYDAGDGYVWRPIPRDRDWAFINPDGPVGAIGAAPYQKVVRFQEEYPPIERLTSSSHVLDRRVLTGLTRADFVAEAESLRRVLTDSVIDEAVSSMPAEYQPLNAGITAAKLRARRDRLPEIAVEFYDWLATDVDVHGTDVAELVTIERRADGSVMVALSRAEDAVALAPPPGGQQPAPGAAPAGARVAAASPYYRRTFLPGETDEVRVYLHGGDDRAIVTGSGPDDIVIRVIGGGDDDRLEDYAGGARFYDDRGDNIFVEARGTKVSRKPWDAPQWVPGARFGGEWAPDWGDDWGTDFSLDYAGGAGIVVGVGPSYTRYGFRRLPYHYTAELRALYALGSGDFGAELESEYRFQNSHYALTLDALAIGFETFRFYGFGNDTPEIDSDIARTFADLYVIRAGIARDIGVRRRDVLSIRSYENEAHDVDDDVGAIAAAAVAEEAPITSLRGRVFAGPMLRYTSPRPPAGSPLDVLEPLGADGFGQIGALAELWLERTDGRAMPRRGYRIRGHTSAFPGIWDAPSAFGDLEAEAAAYIPLPLGEGPNLAVRLGGERVFGDFPVFESAFVGGRPSLRGYHRERFAGDASAYASSELRVPIDEIEVLVRGELGIFALLDAGRVWFDGESPGGWHTGYGGGLWFESLGRSVTVAYAKGENGRFYLWYGRPF